MHSITSARATTSIRPASAARASPAAACAPVYLAGLDDRIRCACCVGMMTTWRDYLLNKCYTHTWMIYIPGSRSTSTIPRSSACECRCRPWFKTITRISFSRIGEMRRADSILAEVYAKAGAGDRYKCTFYPGPHKFDRPMQAEAFALVRAMVKALSVQRPT